MPRLAITVLAASLLVACHSARAIPSDSITSEPPTDDHAVAAVTDSEQTRNYIRAVAEDAGELPDWNAETLADRVVISAPSALPNAIVDAANIELAERTALNDAGRVGASASFADEAPFLAIVRAGEIVGYVVTIADRLEEPQWRGGVHVFYDAAARVIAVTEWSG